MLVPPQPRTARGLWADGWVLSLSIPLAVLSCQGQPGPPLPVSGPAPDTLGTTHAMDNHERLVHHTANDLLSAWARGDAATAAKLAEELDRALEAVLADTVAPGPQGSAAAAPPRTTASPQRLPSSAEEPLPTSEEMRRRNEAIRHHWNPARRPQPDATGPALTPQRYGEAREVLRHAREAMAAEPGAVAGQLQHLNELLGVMPQNEPGVSSPPPSRD